MSVSSSRVRAVPPLIGPDEERIRIGQAEGRAARLVRFERPQLILWDFVVTGLVVKMFDLTGGDSLGVLRAIALSLVAIAAVGAATGYGRTSWLHDHPLRRGRRLLGASTFVCWCLALTSLATHQHLGLGPCLIAWFSIAMGWFLGRRLAAAIRLARPESLLLIGGGDVANRIAELCSRGRSPIRIIGFVDDDESGFDGPAPAYLGAIDQLPEILAANQVDRIVVAFTRRRDHDLLQILRDAVDSGCPVDIVPRLFDFVGAVPPHVYHADGLAFMSVPGVRGNPCRMALKRLMDIVGSICALILLAPFVLVIAVAVLKGTGRPVLFRQERAGRNGVPFTIFKFRTLRNLDSALGSGQVNDFGTADADTIVQLRKDENELRVTRVGSFLRRTSLDELPQLWNVLRGDMSLIGPRPLALPEYELLSGWELRRQDMRPGLTGLWQVSGRSEVTWQKRMALDHAQVHHWSLWSDLEILADTLPALLKQRGAR